MSFHKVAPVKNKNTNRKSAKQAAKPAPKKAAAPKRRPVSRQG
ncbi:hypothetical protein AB0G32_00170 [Streptomyces sp. NPDC023723]